MFGDTGTNFVVFLLNFSKISLKFFKSDSVLSVTHQGAWRGKCETGGCGGGGGSGGQGVGIGVVIWP